MPNDNLVASEENTRFDYTINMASKPSKLAKVAKYLKTKVREYEHKYLWCKIEEPQLCVFFNWVRLLGAKIWIHRDRWKWKFAQCLIYLNGYLWRVFK